MTPSHPDDFTDSIAHAVTESLKPERLSAALRDQLDAGLSEQVADAGRILLTGSGDSLFAARAMRPALERWTGQLVEVRTAIELARYDRLKRTMGMLTAMSALPTVMNVI